MDETIKKYMPIFKKHELYLVGGYIRDSILGKTTPDRDLVILNGKPEILAQELGGTSILLDKEHEIYRVVLDDKINYFDISPAENLEEDAKRRDFTINSIYCNLNSGEYFDPYDGRGAIKNKIIKTADLKNLNDDPLRQLRAFRFAATLGFKIDEEILHYIALHHKKISEVAFERVQYEIIKMFEGDFVVDTLRQMNSTGLLGEIFPFVREVEKIPPNTHHHLPLLEHCFSTIEKLQNKNPLLKIAALMHDIGKPQTWTIDEDTGRHRFIGHDVIGEELAVKELKRLKFSRKQIDFISKMVTNHIYPSSLMHQEDVSDKAMIRFVKKLDPYVEEVIDLARADRLSALGEAITPDKIEKNLQNLNTLLEFYKKIKPKLAALPKLLDGKEIMELLNLTPSKRLGEIIAQLNEAQLEGKVTNKKQAIKFVETL